MKAETIHKFDSEGYVAFGKHQGDKFESVSNKYLNWVYYNIEHNKLQRLYPNFWNYLCDHYDEFTGDNLI